jgi:hypothetical protein
MTEKDIVNAILHLIDKEMHQAQANYYLFDLEFADITKQVNELEKKENYNEEEHDKLLKMHFDLHSKIFHNTGMQEAYEKIIDLITDNLEKRFNKK